jgi:dGTPase
MSRVQNSYAVTEGAESAPGEPNQLIRRVFPAPVQRQHSPFQRDRERIVQARAFRRLAGKTQVFTSRASDHFRSRLTHTIEVVQIARYVATRLGLNEDLAEALALVHDIGHPPFGHAGERALDRCLQQYGLRFDHNLHALRIVDHFEQRYAEHRGLNLTLAVREGIVKHSRDYPAETHPELVEFLPGQRPPLEAQIIDLADEIAYLTGDLDDGVESGHLDADDLSANVDILKLSFAKVAAEHPGIEGKFLFQEALHAMQNRLTADLIANIGKALSEHSLDTLEAVRVFPERIAVFSPEIEAERRQEKQYLYDHLYTCPALTLEHDKAEEVVTALFAFYMDEPQELPEGYLDELAADGLPRIVADYVAGMTDAYILLQYAQVKRRIPLRKR